MEISNTIPTIGLYREVPAAVYHAWPICSNSRLTTLNDRSPKHVLYEMQNPKEPTDAMILGMAAHVAILQPHLFHAQYVKADRCNARKKDGVRCSNDGKALIFGGEWLCGVHIKTDRHEKATQAAIEKALSEGFFITKTSDHDSRYLTHPDGRKLRIANHAPGAYGLRKLMLDKAVSIRVDLPPFGCDDPRIVLGREDYETVLAMRDAVMGDKHASELLRLSPEREVSAVWEDPQTGLLCKARWDAYSPDLGIMPDLKTTTDASAAFDRTIDKRGYHRQSAFYIEGAAAHRIAIEDFPIIAVESEKPHAVGIHRITENSIELGGKQLRPLMEKYAHCETLNEWPSYAPRDASLPDYTQKRINREIEELETAAQ